MRSVHLTIDLDYFEFGEETMLDALMARVQEMNVPKFLIDTHEMVLELPVECTTLVNIDQHDDITSRRDSRNLDHPEAMEGVWVDFVPGKKNKTYIWCHREDWRVFCCDEEGARGLWDKGKRGGWRCVRHQEGTDNIPWKHVTSVSVCWSPDYAYHQVLWYFHQQWQERLQLQKCGTFVPKAPRSCSSPDAYSYSAYGGVHDQA